MGGLVTRYYMQRLGGIDRVERYMTISAPHHGTWMAYLLLCRGGVQMRPSSTFLEDMNGDVEVLQQVNFTSIWTPYDFIIVPGRSSQMLLGKNVKLPVFAHAMMVRDARALEAVVEALEAKLP